MKVKEESEKVGLKLNIQKTKIIAFSPIYCCCLVTSVVSDSVWPHRRQPTRLPRLWDSPGKNTQSHHFMANRWGNNGNSDRFYFLGLQITVDGDCSHEIKRRLLLGRKAMTNLDIILKSRDITLPTKVRLVKAMVFPVVMYGCESWTIKKAEHWSIDVFELWC